MQIYHQFQPATEFSGSVVTLALLDCQTPVPQQPFKTIQLSKLCSFSRWILAVEKKCREQDPEVKTK
jgi:hypothetical protein